MSNVDINGFHATSNHKQVTHFTRILGRAGRKGGGRAVTVMALSMMEAVTRAMSYGLGPDFAEVFISAAIMEAFNAIRERQRGPDGHV